jgi:hypothetical protein
MKTYYIRVGGQVYVQIDSVTKKIINVVNIPTQKGISVLDNLDYYNMIMTQVQSWEISDETTFNNMYNVILSELNNLT